MRTVHVQVLTYSKRQDAGSFYICQAKTSVVLTGGRDELISSFGGGNILRPSRRLTA